MSDDVQAIERRPADGEGAFLLHGAPAPPGPILAGRWHDRFERDGDQWRFADRLIHADLVGDLRFHI
jgi:hypothetical protein